MPDQERDLHFMRLAILEARAARALNEVPIGAVVVSGDDVVGRGHNRRELDQDPVAHAEMFAIREAAGQFESWRLENATLYVTLEPCAMCAGALVLSRVERVVFGCRDPKAGAVRSLYELCEDTRLNHRLEVVEGILADECAALLTGFFADVRAGRVPKLARRRLRS